MTIYFGFGPLGLLFQNTWKDPLYVFLEFLVGILRAHLVGRNQHGGKAFGDLHNSKVIIWDTVQLSVCLSMQLFGFKLPRAMSCCECCENSVL